MHQRCFKSELLVLLIGTISSKHLPVIDITVFLVLHWLSNSVAGKHLLDILLFIGPDGALLVIDAIVGTLAEAALHLMEYIVVLVVGKLVENVADAVCHLYLRIGAVERTIVSGILH